jgi:hypothetical protein
MAGEQTDVLETFREYFVLISGRLLRAVPCLRAGIGHWLFGHARSLYRKPKVWCAGRDTPNAIRCNVRKPSRRTSTGWCAELHRPLPTIDPV